MTETSVDITDEGERNRFIFELSTLSAPPKIDVSRIDFIEHLVIGGVRCVRDGVDIYNRNDDVYPDKKTRAGGILALAAVVAIGMESISAFFTGLTQQNSGNGYNATANVNIFITRYFPQEFHSFSRLLWDGMRNGLIHTGLPKHYVMNGEELFVSIFVSESQFGKTTLERDGKSLFVRINSLELAQVFEEAMRRYLADLRSDADLQIKFIKAWQSLEAGRSVTPESPYGKEFAAVAALCNKGSQPV